MERHSNWPALGTDGAHLAIVASVFRREQLGWLMAPAQARDVAQLVVPAFVLWGRHAFGWRRPEVGRA